MSEKANNIEVRTAQRSDAESMIRIYFEGSGRKMDNGRIRTYIDSLPASIALHDGQVVGFCFCQKFASDIVELANLFVVAEYRNQAIGTRLVVHLEDIFRKDWAAIISSNSMLVVGIPDKRSARNFYLKNDYQLVWSTGPTDVFLKDLHATGPSSFDAT